jgi:hypothetical protein
MKGGGWGFIAHTRSAGNADVAWEKCMTLRSLTFMPFVYKIGNFVLCTS